MLKLTARRKSTAWCRGLAALAASSVLASGLSASGLYPTAATPAAAATTSLDPDDPTADTADDPTADDTEVTLTDADPSASSAGAEIVSAALTTAPGAPTALSAKSDRNQVTLSWTAPASGTVTVYQYRYKTGTDSYNAWAPTQGSTTSHTVDGLLYWTVYTFQVRGVNAGTAGPASSALEATPGACAQGRFGTGIEYDMGLGDKCIFNVPSQYKGFLDAGCGEFAKIGCTLTGRTLEIRAAALGRNAAGSTITHIQGQGPWPTILSAYQTVRNRPRKPTALGATATSATAVTLSWTAPSGTATITDYEYRYKTAGTGYVDWISTGATSTTKSVSGLTSDTVYTFQVRAANHKVYSDPSNSDTAIPTTQPNTPTGLTAERGNTKVKLSWTPAATGGTPTGYQFQRKTSSTSYTTWASAGAGTTHTVTGLTNGTEYSFRIRARNDIGESTATSAVEATPATVPDAPTGLTAKPSNASVTLTWNAQNDSTITSYWYQVKEGTANWGNWSQHSTAHTTRRIEFTELTNDTEYKYRIRARNSTGDGIASDTVSATPMGPPAAPTALTGESGHKQVKLSWTAPTAGGTVTGYEYRHKSGTDGYTDWAPTQSATASHAVDGLTNHTAHTFQVRGRSIGGTGPASGELTATPGACATGTWGMGLAHELGVGDTCSITIPSTVTGASFTSSTTATATVTGTGAVTAAAAGTSTITGSVAGATVFTMAVTVRARPGKPTALGAKPTGARCRPAAPTCEITLSWTASASGTVTGYEYRRKTASTGYNDWTSAGTTTSRKVSGHAFGGRYTFQVRAANNKVYSDPSDPASTAAGHPGSPSEFAVEAADAKVRLTWAPPTWGGTPTGYDYWYIPGGSWTSTGAGTGTGYTVTGLDNGTEYTFRVRAGNDISVSGDGGRLKATPKSGLPDEPTALTATAGNAEVTLAWTKPSGTITDHEYRYKTTAGYGQWTSTSSADATFKVTGLTNNTAHTFQVRAETSAGAGLSSTERTATPASVPAKPTGLTATPGDASIRLTWDNPNNSGISYYQINFQRTDNTATWYDIPGSTASTTSYNLTELTPNRQYTIKIRAISITGTSPDSETVTATPSAPATPGPAKPTGLTAAATTGAHGSVDLSWTDPSDTSITKYQSRQKQATATTWPEWADITGSTAATTTHTITNLAGGIEYTFRIRAVNNKGNSPASDTANATPTAAPPPPSPPSPSGPPPGGSPGSPPGGSPGPPPGGSPGSPPGGSPGSPPGGSPGSPPGGSPGSPPGGSPPSPSPPPPPPPSPGGETSAEDDEEMEPVPAVEVRITARLVSGRRIEFALQQRTDGDWGSPRRPTQRYFPPTTRVGRWLRSTTLNIDGQRLRIVARRLADRRVEFGMQHHRGGAWSARILPTRRFFPTGARLNRWLSSTPLWVHPYEPRPSVCSRTRQVAQALAKAADKPCAQVNGDDLADIERLDLSDAGLRALRATDFGGLANLTSLNLSENRLSELVPGALAHLPRLTTLNLADNRLTRFRTGALRGAARLTSLTLDNNRLTSISSRTLNDAPNLRAISLASNRIQRLSNNTFRQLENLRTLRLTGNPGAPFNNLNTPDNTNITQ